MNSETVPKDARGSSRARAEGVHHSSRRRRRSDRAPVDGSFVGSDRAAVVDRLAAAPSPSRAPSLRCPSRAAPQGIPGRLGRAFVRCDLARRPHGSLVPCPKRNDGETQSVSANFTASSCCVPSQSQSVTVAPLRIMGATTAYPSSPHAGTPRLLNHVTMIRAASNQMKFGQTYLDGRNRQRSLGRRLNSTMPKTTAVTRMDPRCRRKGRRLERPYPGAATREEPRARRRADTEIDELFAPRSVVIVAVAALPALRSWHSHGL